MAAATMTQAVMELYAEIEPALPALYMDEFPETIEQLRGAYFSHEGEVPTYATGQTKTNYVQGRFTIAFFDVDSTAAETKATAVKTKFNTKIQTPIVMAGNQRATLRRSNYTVRGTKLRDKNQNPVYMASISYLFNLQHPDA